MNGRFLTLSLSILLVPTLVSLGCDAKDSGTASAGDEAGSAEDGDGGADDADGDAGGDGDDAGADGDAGDGDGDGDADDGGDDCGAFLGCDDVPEGGIEMCDFWSRDCPDGEKCTAIPSTPGDGAWDANVCVPAGEQPPGSTCTTADGPQGTDTCDEDGMCYDQDADTGIGTCVELCVGPEANPSCPQSNAPCSKLNGGVLNLCIEQCDPLLQDCPTGQSCYAAFEGSTLGGFICFPAAVEGMYGEACGECDNCCRGGLACVPSVSFGPGCTDTGCCSAWCDVEGDQSECTGAGQSCIALFDPGSPLADIGWCAVPQ